MMGSQSDGCSSTAAVARPPAGLWDDAVLSETDEEGQRQEEAPSLDAKAIGPIRHRTLSRAQRESVKVGASTKYQYQVCMYL